MSAPEPEAAPAMVGDDRLYEIDEAASEALTAKLKAEYRAGTMGNGKHYKKVKLSGIAGAKILMHAKRGVDQGVAETGTPIEIIGMLFGYVDVANPDTVIVVDAFEIPMVGSCHEVAPFQADAAGNMGQEYYYFYGDDRTANGYEGLQAELKRTRPEGRFCGWYHSHPFEPEAHGDHCWFSGIDVMTQTTQQQVYENDGHPFVGLVVDPQTSLKDGTPHFGAFRCYDRGYDIESGSVEDGNVKLKSPLPADLIHNRAHKLQSVLCPDGVERSESDSGAAWGGQWNRYYKLEIEFFQSAMATMIMSSLKKNFLWVDALAVTPAKTVAYREEFPQRVKSLNSSLKEMTTRFSRSSFGLAASGLSDRFDDPPGGGSGSKKKNEDGQAGSSNPATESMNVSRNLATQLVTSTMGSVGKLMAMSAD